MEKTLIISCFAFLATCNLLAQEEAKEQVQYMSTDQAEILFDLSFTEAERDSMQRGLRRNLERFQQLHEQEWPNEVPPALIFNPLPRGYVVPNKQIPVVYAEEGAVERPVHDPELAYMTVGQLSTLIKNQKVTSMELTQLYIKRLKRYSDTLMCTITLLEEHALKQAAERDRELQAGEYRGPLHGIPFGIKDLFALEGYPTTWGATPYKDQMIEGKATIIAKLEEAGAVLVVKLTSGALAMGDVWYGGKTKNPWNLEQGSSGSSAGPGSATAAGLIPFAIGTETLGSIVSPSRRNGVTGLRPTFGRVSRTGGMALTWSMDKVGPMCRSANDCAIVLGAIKGSDGIDQAVIDAPFNYNVDMDIRLLRIGYLQDLFHREYSSRTQDSIALIVFKEMGLTLTPVSLPDDIPYNGMGIILAAEAAAAFDELTRSNRDDLLVRQNAGAWPNYFRTARFIPAVEYIQANRARFAMIQRFKELFDQYDAILTPSFGGPQLMATNLTGHPSITFPNGFDENGGPTSMSIIGALFDEGTILALAHAYQTLTDYDDQHPEMFMEND